MEKDLILIKDFAEIKEVELEKNNENCLRVWCSQYPDTFTLQIRTFKPITENKKGKSRNMIAGVNLSIREIEKILKYMKEK